MKIHQGAVLTRDPLADMEAATKRYVDNIISAGGGAGLFVTRVENAGDGIVSDIAYVAGTVPANAVVEEATSDDDSVRIYFLAEGGPSFYNPTVTVDVGVGDHVVGVDANTGIVQDANDLRTYEGYADVTIADGLGPTGRVVQLTADTGASTSVLIRRAPEPPELSTLLIGAYPGSQTAAKGGDIMTVTGTVENGASRVDLLSNTGATESGTFNTDTTGGILGADDSGGAGFKTFTIQFTVDNGRSGAQTVTARARNSFGTYGNNFESTNNITLDQAAPVIGAISVNYPGTQNALKNSETATVDATVTDFTSISYTTSGDISVTDPAVYGASKTVQRIGGNYVVNGNNYTITANKASNDTQTVATGDVNISNVAPTVAITGASSRLISSPGGSVYAITMTFNQQLQSAPTISSSGDATAGDRSAVTGSGTTWSFNLTVEDDDDRGVHTWVVDDVETLSENLYNGVTITTGPTYEIGGFSSRIVTIGALEQVHDIGVDISDPSKILVRYTGTGDDFTYRGSDLTQFQKGFSTVDGSALVFTAGAEPFQNYSNFVFQDATVTPTPWLFLTDANFAGTNTTGTLQVTIEETA